MVVSPFGVHAASPAELKQRLEADRRGGAYLVYRDFDSRQRVVMLAGDRLTIGRAVSADVSLPWDSEISRAHAELERVGDAWTVADNGLSRNGTFVNGERVLGRRRLRDGDVLTVGETALAFRDPFVAGDSTAAAERMSRFVRMSAAQRRVLVALCRPCLEARGPAAPASNPQIAQELVLSLDAVRTHMKALFELFDVEALPPNRKRARLVELALRTGVVSARDVTGT